MQPKHWLLVLAMPMLVSGPLHAEIIKGVMGITGAEMK
jgi:hypothetical protein